MTHAFDAAADYALHLELATSARAAGRFEVAYHSLMAALHCAYDSRDLRGLAEVGRLCRLWGGDVDALVPAHRLSRHAAAARRNVFESGGIVADSMLRRLGPGPLAAGGHRPEAGPTGPDEEGRG